MQSAPGFQGGRVVLVILALVALVAAAVIFKNESRKSAEREAAQRAAVAAKEAERKQEQTRADAERAALQRAQEEAKTKDILAQSLKAVDDLYVRWGDARSVAGMTSRISLSGPVATMQAIKREAEGLVVPPCLTAGKLEVVKGMQLTIEGYLEFMANTAKLGDLMANVKFEEAKPHFANFAADRKLCPAP